MHASSLTSFVTAVDKHSPQVDGLAVFEHLRHAFLFTESSIAYVRHCVQSIGAGEFAHSKQDSSLTSSVMADAKHDMHTQGLLELAHSKHLVLFKGTAIDSESIQPLHATSSLVALQPATKSSYASGPQGSNKTYTTV